MFISMTGHGNSTFEDKNLSVGVEIKSLNSRFFDLNLKCYLLSAQLEDKIRSYVQKKLVRGSVSLNINIENFESFDINSKYLQNIIASYKEIEKKYDIELSYSSILSLNQFNKSKVLSKNVEQKIFKCVKEAVDILNNMRKKEGENILINFCKYLNNCNKNITKIDQIFNKEFLRNSKKNDFVKATEQSEDHLKDDIQEEIDRLKSHVIMINQSIESKEFSGKRISFILQEVLRESNTILAKFQKKNVLKYSIDLKVQTEKLREQISNIL